MLRPIFAIIPALVCAVEVEAAKLATPDAIPVEQGRIEIALGLSWTRSRESFDGRGDAQDRGGDLTERTFEAGATIGIRDGLDAGVTLGWARIDDEAADPDSGSGPTDMVLGAKWQILANGTSAVALLPEVSIPVGDGRPEDELSTGSEDWGVGLTLATTVTIERLALGAAVGHSRVLGSEDSHGTWSMDLAAGWQLTDAIQPQIELHHVREEDSNETSGTEETSFTLGVQLIGEVGRLGLGLDRVIAGQDVERSTSLLMQVVTTF